MQTCLLRWASHTNVETPIERVFFRPKRGGEGLNNDEEPDRERAKSEHARDTETQTPKERWREEHMTPPQTSRAGGGPSIKPRRPAATGSGGMRARAGALVWLSMAVQCRAFLGAPSVGGGACRLRPATAAAGAAARTSAASPLMAYDVKYSPNKWWDEDDIVPGYGGIWPGDPDAETHHVSTAVRRTNMFERDCKEALGRCRERVQRKRSERPGNLCSLRHREP